MQYNNFVQTSFSDPQYVAPHTVNADWVKAEGGERSQGVYFQLFYTAETGVEQLFYKVYGSPYAIAAVESVCQEVRDQTLKLGDALVLERIREKLDLPHANMYILLALEDAWLGLDV